MVKKPLFPRRCAEDKARAATGRRKPVVLPLLLSLAIVGSDVETATAKVPMDPNNPSCPKDLNWSTYRPMRFTYLEVEGLHILKAEGVIDADVASRLQAAIDEHKQIDEIWLRSPGGDARAGNEAGKLIRKLSLPTRIPSSWACFSACNFMFMGGRAFAFYFPVIDSLAAKHSDQYQSNNYDFLRPDPPFFLPP